MTDIEEVYEAKKKNFVEQVHVTEQEMEKEIMGMGLQF